MVLLMLTALLGSLFSALLTWSLGPLSMAALVPVVSSLLTLAAALLLLVLRSSAFRRDGRASLPPPEVVWC